MPVVEQSNQIWMVVNAMTVLLVTNCYFVAGSTITISGLLGSDMAGGSVADKSDFAGSCDWDQTDGNLTVMLGSMMTGNQ
eukprot:104487-Rhodomonas_salina.1